LDEQCSRLRTELDQLRAAVAAAAAEAEAEQIDQRAAALHETVAGRQRAVDDAGARARALGDVLAARAPVVAAARAGATSLAARAATLDTVADQVAAAAGAATARVTAEQLAAGDAAAASAAAADAGFPDAPAAGSAARSSTDCAALERWCADRERERTLVEAELADPALDVPLSPPADPAGAQAALAAAAETARAAGSLADDLSRRAGRVGELVAQLRAAAAGVLPARAAYDEVAGLADLVAGGGANRLRMRLSAFVLAARLEQVADAASVRLARMTAGRYTLEHSDDVGDARRKSGLGLKVADGWTGRTRDAGTLSGGETFMASLALALGLADVVREEAGGAQIECLFVDEGFGSLDDATLDEVMDVLDELRDGGRLVGLVSHVSELKQRVPTQLRVIKTSTGSTVATSATEAPPLAAASADQRRAVYPLATAAAGGSP
ncbi:MAG TPA: SbcC/MukB-like Walker B domain-containing protein, partial [Mycobacteriales bacterium]|nr:SbcC/MukB-like Walker B domain-containing protein [Mycobacteriales bacterium]